MNRKKGRWQMVHNSIGLKMLLYNAILFIMLVTVVLISNISSTSFSRAYNEVADLYRELNSFYRQMQMAGNSAQNHLYGLSSSLPVSTQSLEDYYAAMQSADNSLVKLTEITDDENLRFRFELLRNMMESCDEHFTNMLQNNTIRPSYGQSYERLVRLFALTDGTQQEYYGYLVENMESRHVVLQNQWRQRTAVVSVVVAGIVAVAVVFSIVSARWVTRPINRIVKNIQKIKKGEYDLSEVKDAGPEFAVLCQAFDDMALSICSNIDNIETNARLRQQLLTAENENLQVTEMLTMAELKALQGQMNPHFLFNTLSMIQQIATLEKASQAAELMDITANLLRYSLDKSSRMSTLWEEIACVRGYLHIQRLRFGERVNFSLEMEEDIPDIMLPGMILQPLIENAVLHGVGDVMEDGEVWVFIGRKNGNVLLVVEDNGQGIPSEKLEWLMNEDLRLPDMVGNKSHIGLMNVKSRIEMFYGSACHFQIESTQGVGTVVSISIETEG